MLKAPATMRLKLKYDEPLSNFAFKFNLRRHSVVIETVTEDELLEHQLRSAQGQ
jgi:hypothetical protein